MGQSGRGWCRCLHTIRRLQGSYHRGLIRCDRHRYYDFSMDILHELHERRRDGLRVGSFGHYWAMVLTGTGEDDLQFRLRADVGATTSRTSAEGTEVLANEWTHVAVTWDASDPVMRQYKNTIEIDSLSRDGTVVATGADVKIGIGNQLISALARGPGSEIRPFDGPMDDVQVYDRGLSRTEIFQLASQ